MSLAGLNAFNKLYKTTNAMNQQPPATKPDLRSMGIGAIFLSIVISVILAITVDTSENSLGGIVHYFWPPIAGTITMILFLIVVWITKHPSYRVLAIVLLCMYNLYVGLALHFEREDWPLAIIL
jgi:hypothetical protein